MNFGMKEALEPLQREVALQADAIDERLVAIQLAAERTNELLEQLVQLLKPAELKSKVTVDESTDPVAVQEAVQRLHAKGRTPRPKA